MLMRDGMIYIAAKVVPSALGFTTTIGLTWLLTAEAYGVYGFGLAAAALGSNALFDWHALSFMRWYQSRGQEAGFMPTALALFAAVCAVSLVLGGVPLFTGLFDGWGPLPWVLLPGIWAYAWFEFAARIQVANFRPLRYLTMNLARNALILTGALTAAHLSGSGAVVLAVAFAGMAVAGSLYLGDGTIRLRRVFDVSLARAMMVYGAPICLTTISSGLMVSANRLMVGAFTDMRSVAYLTAADMLVQASIGVIGAGIGSATYSLAVRAVESGNAAEAHRQLRQNVLYLAGLLLPAAVGLSCVAPLLARVLLKPEYLTAVAQTTPWLAASAALLGLRAHYVDHAFQLGNRTWLLARVMVTGALLNVLLNCLAIPLWGYMGAAMSMTAAVSGTFLYAAFLSRRAYPLPLPLAGLSRIALASGLMALAIETVPAWPGLPGLGVAVLAGALTYGASMLALHPGWSRDALRRWRGQGVTLRQNSIG